MSLDDHSARLKNLESDRDDQEKRIRALERLGQWLIGAAASVGFFFGIMSDSIKAKLGLL